MAVLGFHHEALAQAIASAPKLVINITIDQLRSDHLETFAPLYGADGFKRLLEQGRVYTNASYNFTPVDRASATAAIATGTTPYYNSIVAREWLDRSTLRPIHCVYDAQYGYSAARLTTSTIGDELKISTNGLSKVYSFAAEADAAILSAGHAADGAAWVHSARWKYADYYLPVSPWLNGYSRLFTCDTDINKALTDIALHCIDNAGVGLDEKTDYITITYPKSPTALEGYVSLDQQIGRLISTVESKFGHERVLFVLTGTGYTEEREEEREPRFRIPTGKFYINRTANLLNIYLGAIYGQAKYVETSFRNQIFLNHQIFDQKNINIDDAMRRAQEFLLQVSGIRNVYTATQLLTSESSRTERIRNGYSIETCGDLLIEVAPGWQLINEDSAETQQIRASYTPFPLVFYGINIKAEQEETPVTTDRIAQTIAKTIHIRAPNACTSEPLF